MMELALKIVIKSFEDKVDKSHKPYFYHLKRVSDKVPDYGLNHDLKIIGLLHDILEDCPEWNEKSLRVLFDDRIVDCVVKLTRHKNQTYDDYIEQVMTDFWAMLVKKSDLEDNMDMTRLKEITDKDIDRLKKYHKAYQKILLEVK